MKLPKVVSSDTITKKDLQVLRERTIKKMKDYIAAHPKCNVLDMVFKKEITTLSFVSNNVICTHCGHIEEKAGYAIAQTAMGHMVTFTCDCGNKIKC